MDWRSGWFGSGTLFETGGSGFPTWESVCRLQGCGSGVDGLSVVVATWGVELESRCCGVDGLGAAAAPEASRWTAGVAVKLL